MQTSLVLLPGMDGTGTLFRPLLRALDRSLSATVVSYPADEPLAYPALIALARRQLPQDRPYVIVGESYSGPIAVSLAAEHPKGLIGLVVCASFVSNPLPWLRPLSSLTSVLPIRLAQRLLAPRLLLGSSATPELLRLFREAMAPVTASVLRARIHDVMTTDVSGSLGKVGVPMMYVQAMEDRLVPRAASKRFLSAAPDAAVAQIAAPHAVLQCAPQDAARLILDFVSGLSQAGGTPTTRS